ncbi:hypothetical protein RFI_30809, partial [Reticulomyxa filosa]
SNPKYNGCFYKFCTKKRGTKRKVDHEEKNLYLFRVVYYNTTKGIDTSYFCNLIYMTKINLSLRKLPSRFIKIIATRFRNIILKFCNPIKQKHTNISKTILIKKLYNKKYQFSTNKTLHHRSQSGATFFIKKTNNYLVLHTSVTKHFVSRKCDKHTLMSLRYFSSIILAVKIIYTMTILSSDRKYSKHHIKEAYFPLFFFKCICIHSFPTNKFVLHFHVYHTVIPLHYLQFDYKDNILCQIM